MNPKTPEQWSEHLKHTYDEIHQHRMADMPLNNPAIRVHTIGFHHCEHGILGVLITPWCMNLMNLPSDDENWAEKINLSKEALAFPSGLYTFTVGSETSIGKYRMCSLFSPMSEFSTDQAAIATAEAVIHELLNAKNCMTTDTKGQDFQTRQCNEDRHHKIIASTAQVPSNNSANKSALSNKIKKPINRRSFISGAFLKNEHSL